MRLKAVESTHKQEWADWIEDENGELVAAVTRRGEHLAHVLAAAPDMLEVLGKALRHFDTSDTVNDPDDNAVLCEMEAAIAQAKGDQE